MPSDAAAVDLDSVDLSDNNLFTDGPPHELFARMRAEAPVHHNRTKDGPDFWSLTRAAEISEVSKDPTTFSTARGGIFLQPDTLLPLELGQSWVIFKDPPEHTKHREIVAKAFLARTLVILDDVITEVVRSALDKVAATGKCDVVRDIAVPIPLTVMSRMLGSPDEDIPRLLEWNDAIQDGITNNVNGKQTMEQMADHFRKVVDNELIRGMDSLASAVSNAEVDGEHLTDDEIAVYFAVLLFTGTEHTRNAISNGLLTLLEHPDQLKLLRSEPTKLRCKKSGHAPPALDEILRWTSPVNYLARTATKDTTIGDVAIKADDRVVLWYASASRDADAFAGADTFDLNRGIQEPPHFAFGGGGPHHCQGASLANRMLSVALTETIKRLDGLELDGTPSRVPSTFVNAPTSIPVRFSSTG
ncbi:cytochrome P450 [Pseudonocardia spinosispora]|uniref:cytochrome P450 n=1 Tax=Pseudonocardia spinosispora TaxID=103441 RepID=UPI00042937A4|nr:cytochrome P450 [Pseudonocardia spinosispora]